MNAEIARDAERQIAANMGNEVDDLAKEMEALRAQVESKTEVAKRGAIRVRELEQMFSSTGRAEQWGSQGEAGRATERPREHDAPALGLTIHHGSR